MSSLDPSSERLALSAKARRSREQPISDLIAAVIANPKLINFAAGLVDSSTLPVTETLHATRQILSDDARGRLTLQYDTTLGLRPLRQRVVEHVEQLEGKPAAAFGVTPDNVLITTGSQQSLYLIGETLLDEGDIVITANPSYFVFTGALSGFGVRVLTVPMDDDGMFVDDLDPLLARLERQGQLDRVKLIYCTSYYQNPTGLTLSAARRPRLLEIARKYSRSHRILILEDAAYRELRYDGDDLPSIKSFDTDNRHTILTQTFSKPFAPGIKTGYTLLPPDLLGPILQLKGSHDFGSPNLCQQIAWQVLNDGTYARHVERLRVSYRHKRDTMLGALQRFMPQHHDIHWTRPAGGLYVWLSLPHGIDASRDAAFFAKCLDAGVLYVPGDYCHTPDPHGHTPTHHLRLSFGQVDEALVEPGIEKLAAVLKAVLAAPTTSPPLPQGEREAERGRT